MTDHDRRQLREVLRAHGSRLHVLEMQAATFGIHAPPHVLTEITHTRATIAQLEAQINRHASVVNRAALEQLRQQAFVAFYAKEWERAEDLLIQVTQTDPGDQLAQKNLDQAQLQLDLRAFYQAIQDLRAAGNWQAVLEALDDLSHQAPNYPGADTLRTCAEQQRGQHAPDKQPSADGSLASAILPITSRTTRARGTGFVFHRDAYGAYLLTCTHVVDAIGGAEAAIIGTHRQISTYLVASDSAQADGLAILHCSGLWDCAVLPLADSGRSGNQVAIFGYAGQASEDAAIRAIPARLGAPASFREHGAAPSPNAWELLIERNYSIAGYAGAPVLDRASRAVVAVMSFSDGAAHKARAMRINELRHIWPALPATLIAAGPVPAAETASAPLPAPSSGSTPPAGGSIVMNHSNARDVANVMTKHETNYYAHPLADTERPTLDRIITALADTVGALPPDQQLHARTRVDWLKTALSPDTIDLAMLESCVSWFRRTHPASARIVNSVLAHPELRQRIAAAGLAADFARRFEHYGITDER